jgi:hypothetical protein
MTQSTHLALPYIDAAQAQKHVTHNEALQLLDALVHLSVSARDQAAPPASPTEGQRFLVGAGASGAFAGKDFQIATFLAGAWFFLIPRAGWRVFVEAETLLLVYDGAAWKDAGLSLRALQNLTLLGVGATADAANPLSAKLNTALFNSRTVAEGGTGDLRFILNKPAATNTLSYLFQTGFSGRAEFGLNGDDDFSLKVSADGATWRNALAADRTNGRISFPSGAGDGSLAGFRNRLLNAAFAINQRAVAGTVVLAAGAYSHDGVKAGAAGATYTFAASGIDTPLIVTAGSVILPIPASSIEGGVYTLSQAGTAQARVWQGTGSSGSGAYAAAPFTTASLTSATQTNVEFSTGTVLRPQFEPGTVATIFERRPVGFEFDLCQAYYETSYPPGYVPGAIVTSTTGRLSDGALNYPSMTVRFAKAKHVAPTIEVYSPLTGAAGQIAAGGVDAAFGSIISNVGGFWGYATAAVGDGYNIELHWVAKVEL